MRNMPTGKEQALAELRAYHSKDEVLRARVREVWEMVEQTETGAGLEYELLIGNLTQASPTLKKSRYATPNCKALFDERLVIADEGFLVKIEAAVRAFEIAGPLEACPYVRSDEDLFGLTDSIGADPYKSVARLRRMTRRDPEKEHAMQNTIALTYLFFIGHELGHLLRGNDVGSFTEFAGTGSPFEHRLANAVVKLRRHAEEFQEFSFNLPGFEGVLRPGDEIEQSSAALQNQIERLHSNHTKWFQDEVNADETGTRIVIEHLSALWDDDAANTCMYRVVRGVFAAALYAWYRDLRIFCRSLKTGRLTNAATLTLDMMRDRENYIEAAMLFGDMHRFTLLRAERFIEAVIKSRSNVFDGGQGVAYLRGSEGPESVYKLREVVVRYRLLCILMDTAVKIAYVGASSAWMHRMDQIRGTPQLFMMTFESVATAMERLRVMIS